MKTKKLFLMAAMLLTSVCTFAQNNTPLKGDVNGDGKVDIADIVAILKIMKEAGGTAGETTYYWYVGATYPTDPFNEAQNTGVNKWTKLTSIPTEIFVDSDNEIHIWYVAIPHEFGFQAWDSNGSAVDTAAFTKSLIIIGNVEYDLFTGNNESVQVYAVFKP